jgi:hypothetical protein
MNRNIFTIFLDGAEVGRLERDTENRLVFVGDAARSAKIFFDMVAKQAEQEDDSADWWKKE